MKSSVIDNKKNLKNKFILLFTVLSVSLFAGFSNLYGQDQQDQQENNGVEVNTPAEDIEYMTGKLPELLKLLGLNESGDIKLPIDRGIKILPGNKGRYVFEEYVNLKISGDSVTSIHFVYEQSEENSLYSETRELINNNAGDKELGSVVLKYNNEMGKSEEFVLQDISDESTKNMILVLYKNNLGRLIRLLEFYTKNEKQEKREVKRIVNVSEI